MKCVVCDKPAEYVFTGFSFCKEHKLSKEAWVKKGNDKRLKALMLDKEE